MKQPDVLFCIEHVARELAIACAVKHLAAARYGVNVEVISLPHHAHDAVNRYEPRLIAIPAFLSRRGYGANSHLERFRHVPHFNLAFEQLLSCGNRKYRMPKDAVSRHDVLHLAAGDFYRSWLEASGVPAEHVLMIGSLPCQMYRLPYRTYFAARRQTMAQVYGLDARLPWVFFPENFSAAFMTQSHIRHRIRHGYNAQELREYVSWSHRAFREIIAWCVDAAAIGSVELIIRPRPATPHGSFVDAVRSAVGRIPCRHLHFIKEGDVRQWVLASQIVISSFSTTLVEAAVAGKPAYLLAPLPIPATAASEWHTAAQQIATREDFLDLMQMPLAASPPNALAAWADRNLLAYGDAIENLARAFAAIVSGELAAPRVRHPGLLTVALDQMRDGLKAGERAARAIMRPNRRAAFAHDCDTFGSAHVLACTQRWKQILNSADRFAPDTHTANSREAA